MVRAQGSILTGESVSLKALVADAAQQEAQRLAEHYRETQRLERELLAKEQAAIAADERARLSMQQAAFLQAEADRVAAERRALAIRERERLSRERAAAAAAEEERVRREAAILHARAEERAATERERHEAEAREREEVRRAAVTERADWRRAVEERRAQEQKSFMATLRRDVVRQTMGTASPTGKALDATATIGAFSQPAPTWTGPASPYLRPRSASNVSAGGVISAMPPTSATTAPKKKISKKQLRKQRAAIFDRLSQPRPVPSRDEPLPSDTAPPRPSSARRATSPAGRGEATGAFLATQARAATSRRNATRRARHAAESAELKFTPDVSLSQRSFARVVGHTSSNLVSTESMEFGTPQGPKKQPPVAFDRLYKAAKVREEHLARARDDAARAEASHLRNPELSAATRAMTAQRTTTGTGFANYGERLYRESSERAAARQKEVEAMRQRKDDEAAAAGCTFKPEISKVAQALNRGDLPAAERLAQQAEMTRKALESRRAQAEEERLASCSFRPEINERSKAIRTRTAPVFDELYHDAEQRVLRREVLESCAAPEETFKPDLTLSRASGLRAKPAAGAGSDAASAKQTAANDLPVAERLTRLAQQASDDLASKRANATERELAECSFQPAINPRSRAMHTSVVAAPAGAVFADLHEDAERRRLYRAALEERAATDAAARSPSTLHACPPSLTYSPVSHHSLDHTGVSYGFASSERAGSPIRLATASRSRPAALSTEERVLSEATFSPQLSARTRRLADGTGRGQAGEALFDRLSRDLTVSQKARVAANSPIRAKARAAMSGQPGDLVAAEDFMNSSLCAPMRPPSSPARLATASRDSSTDRRYSDVSTDAVPAATGLAGPAPEQEADASDEYEVSELVNEEGLTMEELAELAQLEAMEQRGLLEQD
jgi:hypothetical protein